MSGTAEARPTWSVEFVSVLNALVCVQCRHAVAYATLKRHGFEHHKDVCLRDRKLVVSRVPSYAQRATIEGVTYPEYPIAPVELLASPVRGVRCRGCKKVAVTRYRLDDICERGRCRLFGTNDRMVECMTQRVVGEQRRRRYFEVRLVEDLTEAPLGGLAARVLAQDEAVQRERARGPYSAGQSRELSNLWLEHTGWHDFCVSNRLSLEQLHDIAEEPYEDDDLLIGMFDFVRGIMVRTLDAAYRAGEYARRILRNYEADPALGGRGMRRPQRAATVEGHAALWARFLVFCVRARESGTLPLVFTEEQDGLLEQIATGRRDVFWELSMSFIKQGQYRGCGTGESALLFFVMAASVNASFVWHRIDRSTSIMASLLHGIQACLYRESHEAHPEEKDEFLAHLQANCERWLCRVGSTVGMRLLRNLSHGREWAKQVGGEPRVSWSLDRRTITYEGQPMGLELVRGFIHGVLGEAEEILRNDLLLFQPGVALYDLFPSEDLTRVVDNLAALEPGYNFVQEERNKLRRFVVKNVYHVINDPGLRQQWVSGVDERGDPVLDVVMIGRYLRARTRFLKVLSVVFLVLGGLPCRATEVVGALLANSAVKRGMYAMEGMLVQVVRYNKSQWRGGRWKELPHFMPQRVLRIYLLYVAAVLPFCEALQRMRHMDTATANSWSCLFVNELGGELDGAEVSRAMVRASGKHLGLRLTVRAWRHVAKAIYREKISVQSQLVARMVRGESDSEADEDDANDDWLPATDAAAHRIQGHSLLTARDYYGRDSNLGCGLRWETLQNFFECSVLWHEYWALRGRRSLRSRFPRTRGPLGSLGLCMVSSATWTSIGCF